MHQYKVIHAKAFTIMNGLSQNNSEQITFYNKQLPTASNYETKSHQMWVLIMQI